jgi:hypothetical protein
MAALYPAATPGNKLKLEYRQPHFAQRIVIYPQTKNH